MRRTALGAALVLLALASGCDPQVTPRPALAYATWEEGLTLAYEDPTLAPELRQSRRLQVRVRAAQPASGGLLVTRTFTTLAGQWDVQAQQKDGGVRILGGRPGGTLLLPEGFPERVSRWESQGIFHWVVGRAAAGLPGVRLADAEHATGVWVESAPVGRPGPRIRTLLLPELGEAETRTWTGGRWVTTNILVSRGFTDIPGSAPVPTPGSHP